MSRDSDRRIKQILTRKNLLLISLTIDYCVSYLGAKTVKQILKNAVSRQLVKYTLGWKKKTQNKGKHF